MGKIQQTLYKKNPWDRWSRDKHCSLMQLTGASPFLCKCVSGDGEPISELTTRLRCQNMTKILAILQKLRNSFKMKIVKSSKNWLKRALKKLSQSKFKKLPAKSLMSWTKKSTGQFLTLISNLSAKKFQDKLTEFSKTGKLLKKRKWVRVCGNYSD